MRAGGRAAKIPFFLTLTFSRHHAYVLFLRFTKV
jgi:hypothetical protein